LFGISSEELVKLANSPGSLNTGRTNVRTVKLLLLTILTGYNTVSSTLAVLQCCVVEIAYATIMG